MTIYGSVCNELAAGDVPADIKGLTAEVTIYESVCNGLAAGDVPAEIKGLTALAGGNPGEVALAALGGGVSSITSSGGMTCGVKQTQ